MFCEDGDFLELTATIPIWDLHSMIFEELESRLVDQYGRLIEKPMSNPRQLLHVQTDCDLVEPFHRQINVTMRKRPGKWNSELLACVWGIGNETAERTL